MKTKIQPLLIALTLLASLPRAGADTSANTAITYQGLIANQLDHGSNTADIVFTLFNTNSGGGPVGGPITNTAIAVNSNGLFMTTMDFGSNVFNGSTHWLEIAVRTNGGGAFTVLTPRQLLTATPQAIYALNAGTATIATTATNFSGTISGDVSGPQGATAVLSVGGQPAANIASGVIAAISATSSNIPNTIVKRDGSGNFSAATIRFTGTPHVPVLPASLIAPGSAVLDGNLYLPFPAIIYSGTNTVFVEEGNTFVGGNSGSYPPTGSGASSGSHDVGIGDSALSSSPTGPFNTAIGEQALQFNTTGSYNTAGGYQSLQHNTTGFDNKADGYQALYSNTSGRDNTANGYQALFNNTTANENTANGSVALWSNTTGFDNVANGMQALYSNTNGSYNTANGFQALFKNTSASDNTANGFQTLYSNTTGFENTANGYLALFSNITGTYNIANGSRAMFSNTSGSNNTASGYQALYNNTSGYQNTANGFQALFKNTLGLNNTANGQQALYNNTNGTANTANGVLALFSNTSGGANTANGQQALYSNTTNGDNSANGFQALYANTGSGNTASGRDALHNNTTGINNIGVGYQAGQNLTTGNNNIDIGNLGVLDEGNTIRVGVQGTQTNTYIAGIWGTTLGANAQFVVVDSSGHLGTNAVLNVNSISLGGVGNCPGQQGILNLPVTTANAGMITLGGCNIPFLHGFGVQNIFGGVTAGNFTLTGIDNTGIGYGALNRLTSGNYNTANGFQALYSNLSGDYNTASGVNALLYNTSGSNNTASGYGALFNNTSGMQNVANGFQSLYSNTVGINNSANGYQALFANTTGIQNTANGTRALFSNTSGQYNAADGIQALFSNANGMRNTASGADALFNNTSGINNIGVGYQAGQNLITGNTNIYIGNQGTGENFSPAENYTIRIGTINNDTNLGPIIASTYIAGIYENVNYIGAPVPVYVDAGGHLGIQPSSARYKQNIQSMADASDVLLSLRPVKYQYKPGLDPKGIPQFGLVAEEVDKVDPDLVVHDQQHGIYTVRYEAVNAMLLNEFLKQHQEIASLKEKAARVDSLESRLNELQALVKQLAAQK